MGIKIELENVELLQDSFKNNKQAFTNEEEIHNNLTRTFKLGIAKNEEDENDERLVFKYDAIFEQKDEEGEKVFSKSTVQYLFFFTDINGETIKKLKSSNITEDDKTELVLYLNKLSYPYIKEHIESKYKKANIAVKLPFELDDK